MSGEFETWREVEASLAEKGHDASELFFDPIVRNSIDALCAEARKKP